MALVCKMSAEPFLTVRRGSDARELRQQLTSELTMVSSLVRASMTLRLLPGHVSQPPGGDSARSATPLNLPRPSGTLSLDSDGPPGKTGTFGALRIRTDHAWHDDHATLRSPVSTTTSAQPNRYSRNTRGFRDRYTGAVMVIRLYASALVALVLALTGSLAAATVVAGVVSSSPPRTPRSIPRAATWATARASSFLGQNVSVQQPPGVARLRRRGERARGSTIKSATLTLHVSQSPGASQLRPLCRSHYARETSEALEKSVVTPAGFANRRCTAPRARTFRVA